MVTRGQGRPCLLVYRAEEYDNLVERALDGARKDPALQSSVLYLSANSEEQRPDAQGRIPLALANRTYAELSKECVVVGALDHLEIWNAQAWSDFQTQLEENLAAGGAARLGPFA